MTITSRLLAATALIVALGTPALALDLNASNEIGVGINLHDNNSHNGGTDTSGIDQSLSNGTAVEGNADVAVNAEERAGKFIGKSVISADGQVIGTISQAQATAEGSTEVVVSLAEAIEAETRLFRLDLAAEVSADSDLRLAWTEAQLMTALQAQAESNG
jgi:hypothetical protein